VQLNRAFLRIRDSRVRRKVVDLVSALAGDGEEVTALRAEVLA
jgi:hypothetical protein